MRVTRRNNAGRIVLAAVAVPIASRIVRRIGQGIQHRQGHSMRHGSMRHGTFGMGHSRRQQHGFFHR